MDLSLSVESVLVDGSDLVGVSIDGANASTESHKASPSSSLRDKIYTLACCNGCAACTVSCAEGLSWQATWGNVLPQTASYKVVLWVCFCSTSWWTLGQICENRDHRSDAEGLCRRRWSSQQEQLWHWHRVDNHWSLRHSHPTKTERGQNQGLGHHWNWVAICESPRPERGATWCCQQASNR